MPLFKILFDNLSWYVINSTINFLYYIYIYIYIYVYIYIYIEYIKQKFGRKNK